MKQRWPEKAENMQTVSLHALLGCSVKCLQQKYFLLQISAPWATGMWVCSLPTESRKRLADNI